MINRIRNKKGFTLIELLVVLAVLAIIALIAVPKFTGIREKAKVDADTETISQIKKSLELAVAADDLSGKADATTILTINTTSVADITGTDASGVISKGTELTKSQLKEKLEKYIDFSSKLQASGATHSFTIDKDGTIK